MGYIYKIINDINGKMYVGKTEHADVYKRWNEHLRDCKKDRSEKRPLYEAMNKYGVENFHFEVIEETCAPDERERYWIEKLNTYIGFKNCNGYNATLGGDGKSYLNLDEEEVINYHSNDGCFQLYKTANYFNVDYGTIRKILVQHDIKWLNMSDTKRIDSFNKNGYICQIRINDFEIINKFQSLAEANEFFKKDKNSSNIKDALRGRKNTHKAYGYYWYYENDYMNIKNNGI